MSATIEVRLCDCGARPKLRCVQVAEDAEEAWVECPKCGATSEATEDAYCDWHGAADLWNRRRMEERR